MVEIGDWEHACCGSPYERNSVVELTCLVVPHKDGTSRYVETHHDLDSRHPTTTIRGRVAAIYIRHQDGSTEQLERLPSAAALRAHGGSGGLLRYWWPVGVVVITVWVSGSARRTDQPGSSRT